MTRRLLYAIAGVIFFASFFFIGLPNVSWLVDHNPKRTRFMEIYLDETDDDHPAIRYFWVPYSRISGNLKKAILVAEDNAFFDHNGFDWEQFRFAVGRNIKDKAFSRGGSTITQQLVKNLYLTPDKNPFRKIREWIITCQMERTLSKKRIFEIYLNVIELGEGIYGAEAAARHYFSKSAGELNASESAWLAAILPSPRLYTKPRYARKVNHKKRLILSRMGVSAN